MNLRAWLRKAPTPVKVKLGKETISVPDSRTKWADVEQTILASGEDGDKVVALDKEGTILRSFVYECENVEGGEDGGAKEKSSGVTDIVLVARLLNEAADNAAKRHETAYTVAFAEITGICKAISERLNSVEKNLSAQTVASAKAQAEAIIAIANARAGGAGGDESELMKLLGPMIGPALMKMTGDAPTTPPNGKA